MQIKIWTKIESFDEMRSTFFFLLHYLIIPIWACMYTFPNKLFCSFAENKFRKIQDGV